MNLAIDDLAQVARRSPDLRRRFDALGDDPSAWLAATAAVDGGTAFVAAFRAFLDRFGARAANEIDLASPRFRDDPLPILEVIAASLRGDGPSYRERVAGYEAARGAAVERLVGVARRGLLGPLRVRAIRRLYRTMIDVGGMREHHKFLAVRVFAAMREAVLEIADALAAAKVLDVADDVWYLEWPELLTAWDGGDLRAVVARARVAHARDQRRTPPHIVTSDGEVPAVRYRRDGAPEGALFGHPVSAGVVEGVARVVVDPARDRLEPGEVLVAEFTDPGWTPLFINAAGLVLEVGGALTHGAVVAREYGIPAVVGVRGATGAIRTGQRVRVDGDRGIVEVLDAGGEAAGPPHA
jgi:pyruvate,water dikinase